MRFIGNKTNLLENIRDVIKENCGSGNEIFCDIFSGSGSVGRFFKKDYKVIANDILYFSHILCAATIEINEVPKFSKLKASGINNVLAYLETKEIVDGDIEIGFFTENYSPAGAARRMYFTENNARRIDFIRETIDRWKAADLIDESEFKYLLACLIESVPYISNTTGTYGAYLKTWDKRAFKRLELVRLGVSNNARENACYNKNANELIRKIEGDILYIDPPYNDRQYLPNYHVLETIARNDRPDLKGITGVRAYISERSDYCTKAKVKEAFADLIANAKFTHIVFSYSTDGLLTVDEITAILKIYSLIGSVKVYKIPYARYQTKSKNNREHFEYIFYAKTNYQRIMTLTWKKPTTYMQQSIFDRLTSVIPSARDSRRFVKSPVNYIGGKHKLLPQLYNLFPSTINTFVDLFAGGFNVTANINAQRIITNDMNTKIVEMIRILTYSDIGIILRRIDERIREYNLSKENEEGYLRFRDYYNRTGDPIDLFVLACYSFNYQFRFNNNLEYNNPFGRARSQFSEATKNNLIAFVEAMKQRNIDFFMRDFRQIDISDLGQGDFIYCDPPYLITTGSYNDGNRGFSDWGEQEEKDLCEFLDAAHRQGIRFALSNVTIHKGKENRILIEWAKKYKIHIIDSDYSNCNYQIKDKGAFTQEVLVTNY